MLTVMPSYQRPESMGCEPVSELGHWDKAIEFYDKGDFRNSVIAVLYYINPDLMKGVKSDQDFEISQSHGSAHVSISLTNERISINSPFLNVAEAQRIPLLRKVAEVNFTPLTLAKINLEGDVLWFRFQADLPLCHPFKVYDAISEICRFADDYDDEFIEKYGAASVSEPKIEQLTDKQQEAAWANFTALGEEYAHFISDFEKNRMMGSVWDVIAINLFRLGNLPYVHGTLRTRIEEALGVHYDDRLDGQYRLDKGRAFLGDLYQNTSREDFLKSVYQAEKLISTKRRANPDMLAGILEDQREQVLKPLHDGSSFAAAWLMYVIFVRMLYDFNLNPGYQYEIYSALEAGAGKECNVAVKSYWACYEKILKRAVPERSSTKPGFFSRLFG